MHATDVDPYIAYALKLAGPRGLDPILSHKAAKRADPANVACPDCHFDIYGCASCSWSGVIAKSALATHCSHVYRHVGNVGECLNTYACIKCGEIRTVDSSD